MATLTINIPNEEGIKLTDALGYQEGSRMAFLKSLIIRYLREEYREAVRGQAMVAAMDNYTDPEID